MKILNQVSDSALEPLAEDVASLCLDMLLAEARLGARRRPQPFLLGH